MFKYIELGFAFGTFPSLCEEAIEISRLTKKYVSFDFNGVKVNVTAGSDVEDMWNKVQFAIKRKQKSAFCNHWV